MRVVDGREEEAPQNRVKCEMSIGSIHKSQGLRAPVRRSSVVSGPKPAISTE